MSSTADAREQEIERLTRAMRAPEDDAPQFSQDQLDRLAYLLRPAVTRQVRRRAEQEGN